MSLKSAFKKIESVEFAADLNAISGFRILLKVLERHEAVQLLLAEVERSGDNKRKVFQRLNELLKANDTPEYAHPHDPALAGYLYVLSKSDAYLSHLAASQILRTPQLWWTQWLAQRVLEGGIFVFEIGKTERRPVLSSSQTATANLVLNTLHLVPQARAPFNTQTGSLRTNIGPRENVNMNFSTDTQEQSVAQERAS